MSPNLPTASHPKKKWRKRKVLSPRRPLMFQRREHNKGHWTLNWMNEEKDKAKSPKKPPQKTPRKRLRKKKDSEASDEVSFFSLLKLQTHHFI